ncbi:MAG TPA: toll/interleukin-1 receptor domain-containing protein [Pyrinomonadaceae bacterium]|nr:toll/interleukin-1 receptor domain-containing protein [Pyrinomonadaceae bacterium]
MVTPSAVPPIFISYAHKDNENADPSKRWLDRLREQLEPLVQQGQIALCSDQDIDLGEDWHSHIQKHLNGAQAAVLLVSPAFLASKYIRNSELPVLLRKAKEEGVRILPVILRPCMFAESKFKYPDPATGPEEFTLASLQAAGSPNKALSEMTEGEQDRALLKVAQTLAKLANP